MTSPALFNSLPWDPVKDFAPVSMLWTSPHVLVVNKDSPINSLSELIAYGRANPGKLTYGSPGLTSETHIGSEMFGQMANIKLTPVPYRGTGPAFNDLLAGTIGILPEHHAAADGPLQGNAIKGLAIANATRHPQLPNYRPRPRPAFRGSRSTPGTGSTPRRGRPATSWNGSLRRDQEDMRTAGFQGARRQERRDNVLPRT